MVQLYSFLLGFFSSFLAVKTFKLTKRLHPYFFNQSYLKSINLTTKKIAIISGSTDGLGKEFVNTLINNKFSLVVLGRSDIKLDNMRSEYFQKLQMNELFLQKYKIDFAEKNISEHEQAIKEISNLLISKVEQLNLKPKENIEIGFINCCGQAHISNFSQTSLKNIQKIQSVNLNAFFIMTKLFFEAQTILKEKEFNFKYFMINVSSGVDKMPNKFSSLYSGCKAFQSNMMKVLDYQNKNEKIKFLNVSPLYIKTKMVRYLNDWDVAEPKEVVEGAFKLLGWRNQGAGCIRHEVMIEFPFIFKKKFEQRVEKGMQFVKKMQNYKNIKQLRKNKQ